MFAPAPSRQTQSAAWTSTVAIIPTQYHEPPPNARPQYACGRPLSHEQCKEGKTQQNSETRVFLRVHPFLSMDEQCPLCQPPGGTIVTAPSGLRTPRAQLCKRSCSNKHTHSAGLWAIPSTESGPQPLLVTYNLSSLALTPGEPTPYVCMYVSMVHTHMWYVRGYVLGEEGVNASTSRGRNSKIEG